MERPKQVDVKLYKKTFITKQENIMDFYSLETKASGAPRTRSKSAAATSAS